MLTQQCFASTDIHDDGAGFDAAAAVQLFRAKRTLITQGAAASVAAKASEEAQNHGIAFDAATVQALAREAGETIAAGTTFSTLSATELSTATSAVTAYPWLKYLYNIGPVGIFDAGQIQKHHISALKAAGVVSIINMRSGYENTDGAWVAQEPVNLMNVWWGGASKNIGDPAGEPSLLFYSVHPPSGKHSPADEFCGSPIILMLVAAYTAPSAGSGSILAPTRPTSWACTFPADLNGTAAYSPCADTAYNYEAANALEWGGVGVGAGQNAETEGIELEANGISYFHLPVSTSQDPPVPFNAETFRMYAPQMLAAVNHAAANNGHVLFHCTIGYRTGVSPHTVASLLRSRRAICCV